MGEYLVSLSLSVRSGPLTLIALNYKVLGGILAGSLVLISPELDRSGRLLLRGLGGRGPALALLLVKEVNEFFDLLLGGGVRRLLLEVDEHQVVLGDVLMRQEVGEEVLELGLALVEEVGVCVAEDLLGREGGEALETPDGLVLLEDGLEVAHARVAVLQVEADVPGADDLHEVLRKALVHRVLYELHLIRILACLYHPFSNSYY